MPYGPLCPHWGLGALWAVCPIGVMVTPLGSGCPMGRVPHWGLGALWSPLPPLGSGCPMGRVPLLGLGALWAVCPIGVWVPYGLWGGDPI